jgi:hypothetical protein
MGQDSPPEAPNAAVTYGQGLQTYLKYLPQMIAAEESYRNSLDPARVQGQQGLQRQFGPEQYRLMLDALKQIDPTGQQVREKLGAEVSKGLEEGTALDPAFASQVEQSVRQAQAARGNTQGNAPASAEALFKGKAALDLYNTRLAQAGSFLAGATPEQQLSVIPGVTPDRSSQYVNPNAGYQGQQFGLQNYQNQLAAYQASGSQGNPWATALGGAASGAALGTAVYPGVGTAVGAVAGGLAGYFSDENLKTDIADTYSERLGVPLKEFAYKSDPEKRFLGHMAQDVAAKFPEAVKRIKGWLTVPPEFQPVPV